MKFKIKSPQLAVLHSSSIGRTDSSHHELDGEITLYTDADEPETLKITGYKFSGATEEYSAMHEELPITFKNKHVQHFTPASLVRNKQST